MFTVTSLTSTSISVTLTIHTPVLLNGTSIACGEQTETLVRYLYENYDQENKNIKNNFT